MRVFAGSLGRVSLVMMSSVVFLVPGLASARSKEKAKSADDAPAAEENASEKARAGKRYEASLEPFGVAVPLNEGSALNGGMYFGANSLVELNIAFANAKRSDSSSFTSDSGDTIFSQYEARREGHSSLVAVRYKRFVSNSFYWYAGGGDRMTSAALYVIDKDHDDKESKVATYETHDIGAVGAIGNQWQWDSFMMGCDWIGLYLPIIKVKNVYDDQNDDLAYSNDMHKARAKLRDDLTSMNVQGLRFYLGASF